MCKSPQGERRSQNVGPNLAATLQHYITHKEMKICQAPIKQSTQKRGRERYKMEPGPKSKQKEETIDKGGLEGEHEQIKYPNPP